MRYGCGMPCSLVEILRRLRLKPNNLLPLGRGVSKGTKNMTASYHRNEKGANDAAVWERVPRILNLGVSLCYSGLWTDLNAGAGVLV